MNVKKHIAMALITGLLGVAMISGGTVAYFNDSLATASQIMSGSIKLGIEKEVDEEDFYFDVRDKKPGDIFGPYTFTLENRGSLTIGELSLISSHESRNKENQETDFGSQIFIKEFKVDGENYEQLEGINLEQINSKKIKGIPPAVLTNDIEKGEKVKVDVIFEFRKGENQNKYQENTLKLNWTFNAVQQIDENKE